MTNPISPRWSRVTCARCLAPIGKPCRSIHGGPHVRRVIDGKRGAKVGVSVSATGYAQIRAEARDRGISMTKVVEERIAKLTGGLT